MIVIEIIWFCVTLSLPLIISGQQALSDALHEMNRISGNGGLINGVIKPLIGGYIGKGSMSFTYRGILLESNKEIVMKVTRPNPIDQIDAKHEYEIYSYLGAINNTNIEFNGIPSVYYYGCWYGCYLIAITLMDTKFNEICKLQFVNEVDILIISREFVRSLKYIHSCGICHNDFHSENMMFCGGKGFIIDFNMASKMYKNPNLDCKKSDWLRFFQMLKVEFIQITGNIKTNNDIKLKGLKRVYLAFEESLKTADAPDYDGIYKIINEEIEKYQPAIVSWLSPCEKRIAIHDAMLPIPSIEFMKVPTAMDQINYPNVDFDFFDPEIRTPTCSVM